MVELIPFIQAFGPWITAILGFLAALITIRSKAKATRDAERKAREEATKTAHKIVYDQEIQDRAKFRQDLMERVDLLQNQLQECLIRCQQCESEHLDTKLLLASEKSKRQILESEFHTLKSSIKE